MKTKTLAAFTFVSLLLLTAFVPATASLDGLSKYAGTYITDVKDGFKIIVAVDGDSLLATVADGEAQKLTQQSETRFVFDGSSDWIEFKMESDEVTGLTLYMEGQSHEAKKQ